MINLWEQESYIENLERRWQGKQEKDIKATLGKLVKQGDVVDVGCGAGRMADIFQGSHYLGIDSSKAMLDICKAKGLLVRQGSVYQTKFADGRFDCVLCHAVLFHIRNIPAAINELWRITKPGGRLVFSVFCNHRIKHKGCEIIVNENEEKGILYPSFRNILPYWMLCRTIGTYLYGVQNVGQKLEHIRDAEIHWIRIPKQVSIAVAVVDKTG